MSAKTGATLGGTSGDFKRWNAPKNTINCNEACHVSPGDGSRAGGLAQCGRVAKGRERDSLLPSTTGHLKSITKSFQRFFAEVSGGGTGLVVQNQPCVEGWQTGAPPATVVCACSVSQHGRQDGSRSSNGNNVIVCVLLRAESIRRCLQDFKTKVRCSRAPVPPSAPSGTYTTHKMASHRPKH